MRGFYRNTGRKLVKKSTHWYQSDTYKEWEEWVPVTVLGKRSSDTGRYYLVRFKDGIVKEASSYNVYVFEEK